MIRLSMIQQLSAQYGNLVGGWAGHLVVEDRRYGVRYEVAPEDEVHLAESVVLICWAGERPNGVILPIGDVAIYQADLGSPPPPAPRRRRKASAPAASAPAGDDGQTYSDGAEETDG